MAELAAVRWLVSVRYVVGGDMYVCDSGGC